MVFLTSSTAFHLHLPRHRGAASRRSPPLKFPNPEGAVFVHFGRSLTITLVLAVLRGVFSGCSLSFALHPSAVDESQSEIDFMALILDPHAYGVSD